MKRVRSRNQARPGPARWVWRHAGAQLAERRGVATHSRAQNPGAEAQTSLGHAGAPGLTGSAAKETRTSGVGWGSGPSPGPVWLRRWRWQHHKTGVAVQRHNWLCQAQPGIGDRADGGPLTSTVMRLSLVVLAACVAAVSAGTRGVPQSKQRHYDGETVRLPAWRLGVHRASAPRCHRPKAASSPSTVARSSPAWMGPPRCLRRA